MVHAKRLTAVKTKFVNLAPASSEEESENLGTRKEQQLLQCCSAGESSDNIRCSQ